MSSAAPAADSAAAEAAASEWRDDVVLFADAPAFCASKHVAFVTSLAAAVSRGGGSGPQALEIAATEHLRLTGTYWGLAALSVLRAQPAEGDGAA